MGESYGWANFLGYVLSASAAEGDQMEETKQAQEDWDRMEPDERAAWEAGANAVIRAQQATIDLRSPAEAMTSRQLGMHPEDRGKWAGPITVQASEPPANTATGAPYVVEPDQV